MIKYLTLLHLLKGMCYFKGLVFSNICHISSLILKYILKIHDDCFHCLLNLLVVMSSDCYYSKIAQDFFPKHLKRISEYNNPLQSINF